MTTLHTFQTEIDDIHHREMSKQRAQVLIDKEQKPFKGKLKEEEPKVAKGKAKDDVELASATSIQRNIGLGRSQEVEERILVRPHINAPDNLES